MKSFSFAKIIETIKITKNSRLVEILQDGKVEFFGYYEETVPDILLGKKQIQVRVYQKTPSKKAISDFPIIPYNKRVQIYKSEADACFLDQEALAMLFMAFPANPGVIFARLTFRWSWIIASFGLLRRVFRKNVQILGIFSFDIAGSRQRWLAVKRVESPLWRKYSLSLEVGLTGFFKYLRDEAIKYVVLRHYHNLPKLHREWGDLDILVSDRDENRVKDFLVNNRGPIRVDVWAESTRHMHDITYYPPPLTRKILNSAVDGPAGSRIPAPKIAFLSYAYHALYHKGLLSGIPSKLDNVDANSNPGNNYVQSLAKMASELGISVEITMEDLDEYLNQQGWRPNIDTLSKIAYRNKWVSRGLFSQKQSEEIGLCVYVLKKKGFTPNNIESMLRIITNDGFIVVRKREFEENEIPFIADSLRGGDWSHKGENIDDLMPAMAIIVLDVIPNLANYRDRTEMLKAKIRNKLDYSGASIIHSTDTTLEAWEYVDICFSHEKSLLEKEIRELRNKKITLSQNEKLIIYPKILMFKLRKKIKFIKRAPAFLHVIFLQKFLQKTTP